MGKTFQSIIFFHLGPTKTDKIPLPDQTMECFSVLRKSEIVNFYVTLNISMEEINE